MVTRNFDVVVIGAGPAGSTISTLLLRAGVKVTLCDAVAFPRYSVGESLLPSTCHGIAQMLDVRRELAKQDFVRKNGAVFKWGAGSTPKRVNFIDSEFLRRLNAGYAYQVRRDRFDSILLENAVAKGVEFRSRHKAVRLLKANRRITGVRLVDQKTNTEVDVKAPFIVNAAGCSAGMAGAPGKRIFSAFFKRVAAFGYWTQCQRLDHPNCGNTIVESVGDSWLWFIPLCHQTGLTSVGVVARPSSMPAKANFVEHLLGAIRSSELISSLMEGSHECKEPPFDVIRFAHDWSYLHSHLTAPGFFRLGDAAGFVDPLISSGVHLATFSAVIASRAIIDILTDQADEASSRSAYEAAYKKEFLTYYRFLRAFYHYGGLASKSGPRPEVECDLESTAFTRLFSGTCSPEAIFPEQAMQLATSLQAIFRPLGVTAETGDPNLAPWFRVPSTDVLDFSEIVFEDLATVRNHQNSG